MKESYSERIHVRRNTKRNSSPIQIRENGKGARQRGENAKSRKKKRRKKSEKCVLTGTVTVQPGTMKVKKKKKGGSEKDKIERREQNFDITNPSRKKGSSKPGFSHRGAKGRSLIKGRELKGFPLRKNSSQTW